MDSADEAEHGGRHDPHVTLTVTLRHLDGLSASDRIRWAGHDYDITAVVPDGRRITHTATARRVG